jgi:hypothetical protein
VNKGTFEGVQRSDYRQITCKLQFCRDQGYRFCIANNKDIGSSLRKCNLFLLSGDLLNYDAMIMPKVEDGRISLVVEIQNASC